MNKKPKLETLNRRPLDFLTRPGELLKGHAQHVQLVLKGQQKQSRAEHDTQSRYKVLFLVVSVSAIFDVAALSVN